MTDDIVARLREIHKWYCREEGCRTTLDGEAADEIERLRADLAAARALLSKWDALINYQFNGSREAMSAMTECAQETAHHLYGPPPWPSRIDAALKGDASE